MASTPVRCATLCRKLKFWSCNRKSKNENCFCLQNKKTCKTILLLRYVPVVYFLFYSCPVCFFFVLVLLWSYLFIYLLPLLMLISPKILTLYFSLFIIIFQFISVNFHVSFFYTELCFLSDFS